MVFVPQVHFIEVPTEVKDVELYVNEEVKRFLRVATNVHPKVAASLERVSAKQFLLFYQTATQ